MLCISCLSRRYKFRGAFYLGASSLIQNCLPSDDLLLRVLYISVKNTQYISLIVYLRQVRRCGHYHKWYGCSINGELWGFLAGDLTAKQHARPGQEIVACLRFDR